MSLCCIGGVCVPYSALVPLLLLAVQWLAKYLLRLHVLPSIVEKRLAALVAPPANDGCGGNAHTAASQTAAPGVIQHLSTRDDWPNCVSANSTVLVEWTAPWCQPCQAIQPFFATLAQQYPTISFVTASVDDWPDRAAQDTVVVVPTFILYQNGSVVERYTGSNEEKLRVFVETTTRRIMKNQT